MALSAGSENSINRRSAARPTAPGGGLRFIRELEAGKPTPRMDKVNVVLDMFGHKLGIASEKPIA